MDHRSLIQRYAAGAGAVAEAVRGLSREQAAAFPVPGTWSIHQLAVHLLDSDLVGSDRIKRVVAEPRPLLMGYDENLWLQNLPIARLGLDRVGDLFRLNRELTAELLQGLPREAFSRWGIHSEKGRVSLEELVTGYVEHLDHHMVFMRAKLAAFGLR